MQQQHQRDIIDKNSNSGGCSLQLDRSPDVQEHTLKRDGRIKHCKAGVW